MGDKGRCGGRLVAVAHLRQAVETAPGGVRASPGLNPRAAARDKSRLRAAATKPASAG